METAINSFVYLIGFYFGILGLSILFFILMR